MADSDTQTQHSYEAAVCALNSLQSNSSVIQARILNKAGEVNNIAAVNKYLRFLSITSEDLDKLNIIHIAGTKGKGSTCALSESILRNHGYTTGFFSSPHLVSVTERIRLNGAPINKELFAHYFWTVYNTVQSKLEEGDSMPSYFKFLTLLCFHIFLQERVEAVILEVGIGGRFDCTNAINKPIVCGITSLGIDHTDILGNTIEEIAWNKAGIFKAGCPAVTVRQPDSCMEVLRKCAAETGNGVFEAPLFDARHNLTDIIPNLSVDGDIQLLNASLAVQLTRIFLDRMKKRIQWTQVTSGPCVLPLVPLTSEYIQGLLVCKWPGRFHVVERSGVTYYFDGAHTVESIETALQWFKKSARREREKLAASGRKCKTVLMFNKTGSRTASDLLTPLASGHSFDFAIFCPNIVTASDLPADCKDIRTPPTSQLFSVRENKQTWLGLTRSSKGDKFKLVNKSSKNNHILKRSAIITSDTPGEISKTLHMADNEFTTEHPDTVMAFSCINDAVDWLNRGRDLDMHAVEWPVLPPIADDCHIQVFATGSLYLVGNTFIALNEPVL